MPPQDVCSVSPACADTATPESHSSIGTDGGMTMRSGTASAAAARGGRSDLGGQLLLDAVGLVQTDVDDFGPVFEVVAGVMAMEAAPRLEIAAAQEVGGLVEVDIALDIGRYGVGRRASDRR